MTCIFCRSVDKLIRTGDVMARTLEPFGTKDRQAATKVAVLSSQEQQQKHSIMPPTKNGQPLFANRGMFDVLGADIADVEEEEEEVQDEP